MGGQLGPVLGAGIWQKGRGGVGTRERVGERGKQGGVVGEESGVKLIYGRPRYAICKPAWLINSNMLFYVIRY